MLGIKVPSIFFFIYPVFVCDVPGSTSFIFNFKTNKCARAFI